MPQNLIDAPAEWQDTIVVPAPGDQVAVVNDSTKPYSLFHALSAIAKRTRWLRGLLETHNHDGRYAPLGHHHDDRYALLGHSHDGRYALLSHHHDDRYYTKAETDARKNVWVATVSGQRPGGAEVSVQVAAPVSGPYLIEGHMVWGQNGQGYWTREIWVDGVLVYLSEERYVAAPGGDSASSSWFDAIVHNLTAGTHSVVYKVILRVTSAGSYSTSSGMVKVTRL